MKEYERTLAQLQYKEGFVSLIAWSLLVMDVPREVILYLCAIVEIEATKGNEDCRRLLECLKEMLVEKDIAVWYKWYKK